ncbi:TAF1 transcription initiation factor TFIID subunit TAF1 [Chiua virens]|nr:TAF1 transcription initiation factor TFIID subunit TAF1 [Chiua virens]
MSHQEETEVISTLTGFSLSNVLQGLSLPTGSGLASSLGITGVPALDASQIYNDKWDEDEEAVGADQGEDYEDEVDRELENESLAGDVVKVEAQSPVSMRPRERRVRIVKRLVERPRTVYERFPGFEKNRVLDFSDLFKGYTGKKSRITKRPLIAESVYPRKRDIPRGFLEAVAGDTQRRNESKRVEEVVSAGNIENDLVKAIEGRENSSLSITLPLHDRSFDLVLLSNWEDDIVYMPDGIIQPPAQETDNLTIPANKSLESGAWTQSIIWGPGLPFRDFTQLELNEDDLASEERPATVETVRPRKRLRADNAQSRDKFNLSNDHLYEVAKEGGRHRVRQTFGQLVVEHAYPAQKLQLPFYKTRLSKTEARSFHRPALQFPTNIEIRFSKVRTAKKKKDKAGRKIGKGGNIGEGLHRTSDLTLKDTSNFVLWEYAEEHPPIIPNFGMGSILVNYYRKKDEKDDYMPRLDLGVPFVLEPQDESPFMKFGYVYPGQTFPALYNNLVRAPLFRHKPYPTDFLAEHDERGHEILPAGDQEPLRDWTDVSCDRGSRSSLAKNHEYNQIQTSNNRVQTPSKSAEERLKISRLMKYFPDQNELQMRQRLKEFMEYHRRGPHQGFWRLKSTVTIPSDADMLKMVGPEQVVLMESMQVGQRHLQDAGYSQTAEQTEDDEGETKLSIEQQLAPWITTKNFLFATQAKAMLRLHGDGDPSGRGEAFSFIRISMKDIFVKAGEDYEQKLAEAENRPKSAHRYNVAEQQQIYKSEIERIWKAQFDSLSRKDEPQLTPEDEAPLPPPPDTKKLVQRQSSMRMETPFSPAMSPGPARPASPAYSRGSSLERDRETSMGPDSRKVLRIKRLVDDEWQTEIIRDPAVIRAYMRARQLIEEENTLADNLAPTGDADTDKRYKKRLEERIARMKKNQERRLHRKNAKLVKEGGTPMQLSRPLKPDTTRRCGHCGQMGHMKTNRKCPRWAEFNSGAPPVPATPSAASPPPTTPGPSSFGGFGKPSQNASFGFNAAVPSPLATSPPLSAMEDVDVSMTPSSAAPKIKLTLKRT